MKWLVVALILFTGGAAWANEPQPGRPEDLGFSAERLRFIDTYYTEKVQKGEMAGLVLLVARHGKIAHFSAIGYADTASHKKMQEDSIFRFYSMTKPIAATALMLLYEEGKFQLDDPISKYISGFAGIRVLKTPESPLTDTVPADREPTLHDLFRHSAGLIHGGAKPPKTPIDEAYLKADLFNPAVSLDEMMHRLVKIPLHYQPGTKFEYSVVQDVQARLVEILSGMSFDQFLEQRLFAPLGMKDTAHWVKPEKVSRLVPVHWVNNGKLVPCDMEYGCSTAGFDASEIASYTKNNARKGGSFGLTGTAEDYWRFAQMMANGGVFNGHRLLSPSTVRYMARDHLGAAALLNDKGESIGVGWGLGFAVVKDAAAAGSMIPDGSYYWAGAANTFFWIDPINDIVVVGMTQSMDPKIDGWPTLREQVGAMVYGALME